MSKSIYGIDLVKHSFSIHGEDETDKGTDPQNPFLSKNSGGDRFTP
ncbi:hypothetical protein GCM10007086_29620 [Photobacterium aphoticum]|nr:hypothetical protein GCM10007086_29620 [Photobacterium aphoticum]